eukprot:7475939-Pyramimonas_sp.AAC.1
MAARSHCGAPLARFVAPQGAHLRPQWQGPHGGAAPFWRTPHGVRGPLRSSTEGPPGGVRTAARL